MLNRVSIHAFPRFNRSTHSAFTLQQLVYSRKRSGSSTGFMCRCLCSGISFAFKVFHGSSVFWGGHKTKITIYKRLFWLRPKPNTPFHSGSWVVGHVLGFGEQYPNTRDIGSTWIFPQVGRRGLGARAGGTGGCWVDPALGFHSSHQILLLFTSPPILLVCC